MPGRLKVTGIPSSPAVNVRQGPGTQFPVVLRLPVGTSGLPVLEAQPDALGQAQGGKTYQWLRSSFPGGAAGWLRDDLVEINGDLTDVGYGIVSPPRLAFSLMRSLPGVPINQPENPVTLPPIEPVGPAKPNPPACLAVITGIPERSTVNVRSGPSLNNSRLFEVRKGTAQHTVLEVQPDARGQRAPNGRVYQWFRVAFLSREISAADVGNIGWVRDDLLAIQGECAGFGYGALSAPVVPGSLPRAGFDDKPAADPLGRFPTPMRQYAFTTPYQGPNGHWGWDLARADEPIYCGPLGGTVVRFNLCQKCSAERPSIFQNGLSEANRDQIINDPAWGNGYGNFVIVRYTPNQLAQHTNDQLERANLGGANIFVMYAHLKNGIPVRLNQVLTGETVIGLCGNTGYSTGPHLHLEVRAGRTAEVKPFWTALRLMDPAVMFQEP